MFSDAVPAPGIGAAFAESMECKKFARPDWLDCAEHQERLHAVVEPTTVEECRARDYMDCATFRACPNTSKKHMSTQQRRRHYPRRQQRLIVLADKEIRDQ